MPVVKRAAADRRGFASADIMVAFLVLGLLVMIVLMNWTVSYEKGREAACRSNLRRLEAAISAYRKDHEGANPGRLEDLAGGYLEGDFKWECPSGDHGDESGDYRDNYDGGDGRVICPWPRHNP